LATARQVYTKVGHKSFVAEIERLSNDLQSISTAMQRKTEVATTPRPTLTKLTSFESAVRTLVDGHKPAEPFRKGSPHRYLAHTPPVLATVDGSTPEAYESVRKPMTGYKGGLVAVEQSLRSLREAKNKYGNGCRIGISYTIQKANFDDVENMVRFAESCEPLMQEDGPVVVFKLAHGRGDFLCNEEQLRGFEETVLSNEKLLNSQRVDLRYMKEFFQRMSKANMAIGEPLYSYYKASRFTCFTPYLFSLVDAFGDVYVCCHLYDDNGPKLDSPQRREYCLGSVVKKSFAEVWKSDKYQEIRQKLLRIDVETMPKCRECTRHYLPNTAMTSLFEDVYRPMIQQYGEEKGREMFESIVSDKVYPPETVWF
jgi:hypothetical protein